MFLSDAMGLVGGADGSPARGARARPESDRHPRAPQHAPAGGHGPLRAPAAAPGPPTE